MSIFNKAYRRLTLIARLALYGALPPNPENNRYSHLLNMAVDLSPSKMIEIGTWRGDRSEQFLSRISGLQHYVGFDLFENMDGETFEKESMGQCHPANKDEVEKRLRGCAHSSSCSIDLVQGPTELTLPSFAINHEHAFDFIFMDGGHSLETVANDWKYGLKLLSPRGTIVLDDYYLNDASKGVKRLVDGLLDDPSFEVRFFPMIESIIDDLQITMVAIGVENPARAIERVTQGSSPISKSRAGKVF